MPSPKPTGVRFPEEIRSKIADLSYWWSGESGGLPSLADVVHTAITKAHKAELDKRLVGADAVLRRHGKQKRRKNIPEGA
jgi:hypothetical protein